MRVLRWERYVPDVEDNRARHERGEPALVVELRAPTARTWRRFWGAVAERPDHQAKLRALKAEHGDAVGSFLALKLATYDDPLVEILWLDCVGPVEVPEGFIEGLETPIRDGRALWAARDILDVGGAALYADILNALLDRADLEAGLDRPLVSPSPPPPSRDPDPSRDGIVASAAPPN